MTHVQIGNKGNAHRFQTRRSNAFEQLTNEDFTVECDATNGAYTEVLPSWVAGKVFCIKKVDSSGNAVTIAGFNTDLIDGAATTTLTAKYQSVLIHGGTVAGTWNILAPATAIAGAIAESNLTAALAGTANGLGSLRVARFQFDPSTTAGLRTVAAHGTGVTIPINAIVVGGFVQVNTLFTSASTNTGTIAISVEGANDIITAAAVSGAPYSSIGKKAIVPKANTPESTGILLTAAREITCTVAVAALTAGKLTGFLFYVQGDAQA
jgi:hypothetical protein